MAEAQAQHEIPKFTVCNEHHLTMFWSNPRTQSKLPVGAHTCKHVWKLYMHKNSHIYVFISPVAAITVLVFFAKLLETGEGSALVQGQTTWKCQVRRIVGHAMVTQPSTVPTR